MKKKQLLTALILLNVCFIWGNSMLPGSESSEISGGILAFLQSILPFFSGVGEFLLRKLGHFSEFACLGLLLCLRFSMAGERGIHGVTMPMLCGVLAAMTDETIQVFVPERGPSVIDVWIDTAGVCTGIAVAFTILWLCQKHLKGN